MEKITKKKYLLIAGVTAGLVMFLVQWFFYVPYESCSQIPQGFNRPCSALINAYILSPISVLLAIAAALMLLKKQVKRSLFVSTLAVLLVAALEDIIFWLQVLWLSIPVLILTTAGLFILSDLYFNKWSARLWVKMALGLALVLVAFLGIGILNLYVMRLVSSSQF